MANRWGNSRNSGWLYFLRAPNHCRWWLQPWNYKNTGVGCHFLLQCMKVKSESEVAQSCPTLCDPMDCRLPGSSIHGIFQARVLEWQKLFYNIKCLILSCNLLNTVFKVKSRRVVWVQNGCISCWHSWLLSWLWAAVAAIQYLRRVSCITRPGKDKNSKFEVHFPLSGTTLLPSSSQTNKSKHQER